MSCVCVQVYTVYMCLMYDVIIMFLFTCRLCTANDDDRRLQNLKFMAVSERFSLF